MAKYQSRYSRLGFYVSDEIRYFSGGLYETEDAAEIAVLDQIADVTRIDEQPEVKAPPTRKASAK